MVFFGEKWSQREASCWSLLVVKGGSGFLFVSLLSTALTVNADCFSLSTSPEACSAFPTLAFFPPILTSLASKGGGLAPSRAAVIVQYSSGLKFRISSSRSQTIRTATDCTRPAESPRLTLSQRMGLI